MCKIHTRGGKFPSFATQNAHFLQAVCLWQGCSFYFQFGATEFFVAPFVLPNFVANLPPRGAFFVVLFPFLLTWRCRLWFFPIARCFCFVGFGCVCATCRWSLLNKPFHCFLFAGFFKLHSFCFPNNYLAKFQQNVIFAFGHFNNALGSQQVCISLTWRCQLWVSPIAVGLRGVCRWHLLPLPWKKILQIAVCFGGSLVCVERDVAKCSKMQF